MPDFKLAIRDAITRVPATDGSLSVELFRHGTLRVKMYAPRSTDPQKPHTQDEVYIIARGTGTFSYAGERVSFAPGDFLFAPAGVEHRFEHFTDDFATWVIFYGPEGGEK